MRRSAEMEPAVLSENEIRWIRRRIFLAQMGGIAFLAIVGLIFLYLTASVSPLPIGAWFVVFPAMLLIAGLVMWWDPGWRILDPLLARLVRGQSLDEDEAVNLHRKILAYPLLTSAIVLVGTIALYTLVALALRAFMGLHRDAVGVVIIAGVVSGIMWAVGSYFVTESAVRPLTGLFSSSIPLPRRVPLSAKIFASGMALVTASLGFFGIMTYSQAAQIVEAEVSRRLWNRTAELAQTMALEYDGATAPPERWQDDASEFRFSPNTVFRLVDRDGTAIATYAGDLPDQTVRRMSLLGDAVLDDVRGSKQGTTVDRYDQVRLIAHASVPDSPWKLVGIAPRDDFDSYLGHFKASATASLVSALLISLVIGSLSAHSVTAPLAQTTRAAHLLASKRDFSQRVPFLTNDEVGQLGRAFNEMAATIQEYALGLEKLVEQRTAELQDTNRELETNAMKLSAKEREMRELLHVVSHDLRAPLINVQGFSTSLRESATRLARSEGMSAQERDELAEEVGDALDFIRSGVKKMDALVHGLLELARIDSRPQSATDVDLNQTVDEVVESLRFQLLEKGIEVHVQDLPVIRGEALGINQVFANLIDNAIKYMGDGEEKRIWVGSKRADPWRFFVRDSGRGIGAGDRDKLFRLFSRLDPSDGITGDGIGLAAVKKIVERHGGQIWVDSEVGRGSTFWFTLGRADPVRPEQAAKISKNASAGS